MPPRERECLILSCHTSFAVLYIVYSSQQALPFSSSPPHLSSLNMSSQQNETSPTSPDKDSIQTDTFEHDAQTKNEAVPYSAMQFPLSKGPHAWKKRPRSPGLKWYKDYNSPASLKNGRLFVVDYIKQGKMLPYISTAQLRREEKIHSQNFL